MTELELFDKLNPRRDLPQYTCDVIHKVWEVMNKENEQLKTLIEKMKSDVKRNIKWAEQNKNELMRQKLCSMFNQWELAE